MRGFVSYVDERLPLTLFTRRAFRFEKSDAEVMLQIADVVSGSWARILDPKKLTSNPAPILALLQRRSVGLEVWPPAYQPEGAEVSQPDTARDEIVRRHCLRQAQLFLRAHQVEQVDDALRVQIEIVNVLLFNVRFGDASRYVATAKILQHLATQLHLDLTQRNLRTAISSLRDEGVVIGTSSKGYKLPICEDDIRAFVQHTNTIVPPMLARIRRACDDLKIASSGTIDMLDAPEFDKLRRLIYGDAGSAA